MVCRKGRAMNLVHDWKRIAKKAWSFRLMATSFVFEGAELLLPLFVDAFPRGVFSVLSLLALAGGIWARFVAQPKMYEPDPRTDPLNVRINPIGRRK